MCTVTYLPLGKNHFILTSNRDESPERRALSWQTEKTEKGDRIHFPRDPLKGGTWFAVSDEGRAACLLNGAFEPFKPDPGYTISRGTVIPGFLHANNPDQWVRTATFTSVAPFTLILFNRNALTEVIWDGSEKHIRKLGQDEPRIWSSVTLYPPDVRQWRQRLFQEWIADNPEFTQENIMQFHRTAGNGNAKNGLVINRNEKVKTLSITSLESGHDFAVLKHLNLDLNTDKTRHFQFHPVTSQL